MAKYDTFARDYNAVREPHDDIRQKLVKTLALKAGTVLLDLGCGCCTETCLVCELGVELLGVDRSLQMIRLASRVCSGHFIEADLELPLPLKDHSVDSIVTIAVIHHIVDINSLFSEVYRTLGDGRFAIVTNSPEQIAGREYYAFFEGVRAYNLKRFRDTGLIAEALEKAGLGNITVETLARPLAIVDSERLERLATGALDSAFWILSEGQWEEGLKKLRWRITNGELVRQNRDRTLIVCSRR